MALIISIDGVRTEIKGARDGKYLTVSQINIIVGGYFEYVCCDPEVTGGYDHFFCNENGKLKGLPINVEATRLSTYTKEEDVIVGNVVFCKSETNLNNEGESI